MDIMATHARSVEVPDDRMEQFQILFGEFLRDYVPTEVGEWHRGLYEPSRAQGRQNFEQIRRAADRGEDVTDAVLLKLLPYNPTPSNEEKGAWRPVAPAIRGDLKKWYESTGWTDPEDWPKVARAILAFVHRCNAHPEELQEACEEFTDLPHSTGFQTGMLTPILNALRPDDFLVVNRKSRDTINYFADTSHRQTLRDYAQTNATGWSLVHELTPVMQEFDRPEMRLVDLFDMFCHWIVAERGFELRPPDYWKVAPGRDAWQWNDCRQQGFIAIGWDPLGDLSAMTEEQFEDRCRILAAEHDDWTERGMKQAWTFAGIREGDRIVANNGMKEVLGFGTVVGRYHYADGERHAHRYPVRWDDVEPRQVDEPGWRRTLVNLDREKYAELQSAPKTGDVSYDADRESRRLTQRVADGGESSSVGYFTSKTFELLEGLQHDPTKQYYMGHKDEFQTHVIRPFRQLFRDVADRLPRSITERMETERRLFSRILKNDYGQGGAWPWYWAAFYPKGSKRTDDTQLSLWINHERLTFGFYIADYADEKRDKFSHRCRQHGDELRDVLREILASDDLILGPDQDVVVHPDGTVRSLHDLTWQDWLANPEEADFDASVVLPRDEVLSTSKRDLRRRIAAVHERLFPLVLLGIDDNPVAAIADYLGDTLPPPVKAVPEYSLSQCAAETHLHQEILARWTRAIERKKQAILYGPPGTGKTYLAEHLARHLIGGGDGFYEVVQFHPAYAYEDFIQGLRPDPGADGGLRFERTPGRFLDFCRRAEDCTGRCVLIVDEINRANLSRVFGELMYLLEYREREVPLAGGGTFRIPGNVRTIGTMNTADRSIALVDHALRRRFAFLALYPGEELYDVLRQYHASSKTGFDVEPLIRVLNRLNRQIDNRHYAVGITFFLLQDPSRHLEDIWQMEIEPYLEEYFFDQPDKVDAFRWSKIREEVMS